MAEEELRIKLGDDVRERYRVINRDYREGDFVPLGQTESGTPIEIDREVLVLQRGFQRSSKRSIIRLR
jgi:nickel-dependent lactate racemase